MSPFFRAAGLLLQVVLVLGSGTILSGQSFERRVEDIVNRTWLKIGPFRIIPSFGFSNFGWVSNVYGQTGEEEAVSDIMITPSLKVGIYFVYRSRLILSFTENPEYHMYLKLNRLNHFTNNYAAELSFPFLSSLVISGGFASRSYRQISLAEVDRQVETDTETISVDIAYETPRRLSWMIGGFARRNKYDDIFQVGSDLDELAQNLNREEVGGRLEVRYEAFRASRLFMQFEYVWHTFLDEASGWRDTETRTYLAGIRFPAVGRISGSIAAGYASFQRVDREAPGYSGFVLQSQLGIRLASRASLALGYNRGTSFSYWSNLLFYQSDSINAGLTVAISRFLDVRLAGNYFFLHYPATSGDPGLPPSGPPPGWADRYGGFSAGFTIPVWKSIRAGLTYQYWTRPSGFYGSGDGHLLTVNFVKR